MDPDKPTARDKMVSKRPPIIPKLIQESIIAILKLNTSKDVKSWEVFKSECSLGDITNSRYDRDRNNAIEKIPRIERSRLGVIGLISH